jgi:hypothetical protein
VLCINTPRLKRLQHMPAPAAGHGRNHSRNAVAKPSHAGACSSSSCTPPSPTDGGASDVPREPGATGRRYSAFSAQLLFGARWPEWTSLHQSTGTSWLENLGHKPAAIELEHAGQVAFPHGATPAQKITPSSVMHEPPSSEREPDGQVQQFPS